MTSGYSSKPASVKGQPSCIASIPEKAFKTSMPETRITYILILTIFFSQLCIAQQHNGDSLFNRFRNDIRIELARHNRVVWDDETKESYYTLVLNSPVENLVRHIDDSIPAIRSLVFIALLEHKADTVLLSDILAKHIYDSAWYEERGADVTISWRVNENMQFSYKLKLANNIPDNDYASRLATIRNRFRFNIPGLYHGIADKDSLLSIDTLTCSEKAYKIVSFSLSNSRMKVSTINCFNDKIKEMIRNTPSGEIIYLDNIIATGPGNERRKLPSLVLEIR